MSNHELRHGPHGIGALDINDDLWDTKGTQSFPFVEAYDHRVPNRFLDTRRQQLVTLGGKKAILIAYSIEPISSRHKLSANLAVYGNDS